MDQNMPTVLDSNLHPADTAWLLKHTVNATEYKGRSITLCAAHPTLDIEDVPVYVLRLLNRPGYDVTADAIHWAKTLNFTVDPSYVRPLLVASGSWSMDEVLHYTDDVLAGVMLWIACVQFYRKWADKPGRPYVDTFDPRLNSKLGG